VSGAPIDYSVTGPQTAGEPLAATPPSVADRLLTASTTTLLLVVPFAGSAGVRGGLLVLAAVALGMRLRANLAQLLERFPRPVLALFAAWAALSVASVAWSRDRAYSLAELKPEVLYPSLALTFFFLAAREDRWRPWWNALMAGTVIAIAANLLQDRMPFAISRHALDGGPGHLSTHLVLIAPLLFALAWPRPWGREHGATPLVVALAFVVAAAWLTENRMVWPALGAQLAAGIAAWRASAHGDPAATGSLARVTLAAGIIVVAGFATTVIERNGKGLRLANPFAEQLERDLRPRIWGTAAERFREAPLLGHGFGREILADAFLPLTRGVTHPEVRHAHNTFFDVALQTGLAGLALFIAVLVALALEYRRYLSDARTAPLGVIGLAVLAGFAVKNLTDDFLYRHNSLLFWAIHGILLGLACNTGRRP
jgi:O-antigen ligase